MLYQIIKYKNFYAIASIEDINQYSITYFLPYELPMKFKKELIDAIEASPKFKNKTSYKTIYIGKWIW